jgi:hypothetical protein
MRERINKQILYLALPISVLLIALTPFAPQFTPFRPERISEPLLYLVQQACIGVQRSRLLNPQHLFIDGGVSRCACHCHYTFHVVALNEVPNVTRAAPFRGFSSALAHYRYEVVRVEDRQTDRQVERQTDR